MSLQRCMDHLLVAVSLEIGLRGQDVLSQILTSFFVLGLYKNPLFILDYHHSLLYSVFGHWHARH
jgi:hypothetical protein